MYVQQHQQKTRHISIQYQYNLKKFDLQSTTVV
jgi:hypothetical protein